LKRQKERRKKREKKVEWAEGNKEWDRP
jgi:hypothetical protein